MKGNSQSGDGLRLVRNCLSFVLMFVILLVLVLPGTVKAAEKKRMIYVVFDDSGSMDAEFRWSRAKYALEVFTAMLDDQDTLKVFALNSGSTLEMGGNDKDRVQKIHQWGANQNGGSTPFGKVEVAAKELINKKSADKENLDCWLIVLTDGEFDEVYQSSELENKFDGWNDEGIKTIYMGIGSGAKAIRGNPGKGAYAYKAEESTDILHPLKDIANRIFERLSLPASHIQKSGNTYTLNLDIPTKHIIVFAQGDNIRMGELIVNGGAKPPTELLNVQYSENKRYGDADTTLKGVVAIYDSSPTASMIIDVSNCTEVEFYYDPAVNVSCELDGKVIPNGSEIIEGKYHIEGVYTDSNTGNPIKSDLLDDKAISLILNNVDYKDKKFGVGGGDVNLKAGTVKIRAEANLKTTVLSTENEYKVVPYKITIDSGVYTIGQEKLKNNSTIKFRAIIVDADPPHNPVSQQEWDSSVCSADEDFGIKLDFSKTGLQCPEIDVIPSAINKLSDVQTGELTFTVHVKNQNGTDTTSEFTFKVIPYQPILIQDAKCEFDQFALGKNNTAQYVEIKVVEPGTFNDIPNDVFGNTDLKVHDSGNGLQWIVDKTQKPGIWKLTPQATGKKVDIVTGERQIQLEAIFDDGQDFTGAKAIRSSSTLDLTINATPPRSLDLSYDVPPEPYLRARQHLEKQRPINITATYNNTDIPQSAWDAAQNDSLQLTWDKSKFDVNVEKSNVRGIWNIYVKPFIGKGYHTAYGTFSVEGELSIYDPVEEVPYSGSTRFAITLEPDWLGILWEFWLDWWWAIVGGIIAAGYIFKKKFTFFALMKMKKVGVCYVIKAEAFDDGETTTPINIKKKLMTFLLPFVAQRVVIQGSYPPANCSFGDITAKALDRFNGNIRESKFTMTNKNFSLTSVEAINNITQDVLIDSSMSLNERKFKLIGFTIKGIDRNGDVKVIRRK